MIGSADTRGTAPARTASRAHPFDRALQVLADEVEREASVPLSRRFSLTGFSEALPSASRIPHVNDHAVGVLL